MSRRYSRVTVVGVRRRLDMVLPSDEPVGRLLPDLLRLLDEPFSRPPRPRQLATRSGDVLDTGSTLTAAGVPDGAVLELVGVDDSPPAPIVHDVTEDTADDLEQRSWRWGREARRWTATAGAAGSVAFAAVLLRSMLPGAAGVVWLALLGAAGCLLGIALAQVREPVGTAVLLGASAVALQAGWVGSGLAGWSRGDRVALVAAQACALLTLLGAATKLGRGGTIGGGIGMALAALWWVGRLGGLPPDRLAAVMVCVTIGVIGLLPRLAMAAAGLTRLDDQRAAGAEVARRDVTAVLTRAHRTLSVAVLAVAASGAVAGWLLAARPSRWSVALAALLSVVLLSRARSYPLAGAVLALVTAAAVVLLALLRAWAGARGGLALGPLAAAAGIAVACVALVAVDPPEHVKARLRRGADRVEALAVVATLPVAVGVFGTYSRLLDAF